MILSALDFYVQGSATGPIKPDLPRFLVDGSGPDGAGFEVEIDDDLFAILAREAYRQSVALEDLLNHAVFLYLAHLSAPAPSPFEWRPTSDAGGSVQPA